VKPVLLCDLDGVLVDSTAAIARVYRAWARSHGLDEDHVVATAQGRPAREVVRSCAPALDADAESVLVEAAHEADQDGVVAIAGAADLLTTATPKRLAVVTSCTKSLARARFRAAGLPRPRVLVTADMLTRGKPDPEGYLLAAAALGAEPTDCVVFEDAPAGIAAGKAAGASVIAIATTHPRSELAQADAIAGSVAEALALLAADGLEPEL
jgi:sugar-phosphatase